MAVLSNAQFSPFNISPGSWAALIGAGAGAYLWQANGAARQAVGAALWLIAMAAIVLKV